MTGTDIPNTGRMIDFWLGGRHFLPLDADTAQAFEKLYENPGAVFREHRRYLARVVAHCAAQGIRDYIVFGSGIPTQGNVHEIVPDARVLYTDLDEINVALGRRIVHPLPHVDYVHGDARDLASVDGPALATVLRPSAPVGIVFAGVAGFLSDSELSGAFRQLHDWAPQGSRLAFDFDSQEALQMPAADPMAGAELLATDFYLRSPDAMASLLGPWTLSADGIQPVGQWGMPQKASETPPFFYGGIAAKD